jgi:Arc/MetJ family transcription regulator
MWKGVPMAATLTSIRLDKKLADEVKAALGVKTRTEAVHIALKEMAALNRFKKLMAKTGGKLRFAGDGE